MSTDAGTRFGRTLVTATTGELTAQQVEALIYPANSRGVMSAVRPASIRAVGGAEIEREAMQHAPLALGAAILTRSGALGELGIRAIIHATVSSAPGAPARLDAVRRAMAAALDIVEEQRMRSVAVPRFGSGSEQPNSEGLAEAEAVVDELVAHLRRYASRLERVVLVSRFTDDAAQIEALVRRARERSWRTSV